MVTESIGTGKTVDLAIEAACTQLGVDRSDVQFEIIDLPKTSFLGLKHQPAKVRVYIEKTKEDYAKEYLQSVLEEMGAKNFTIDIEHKEDAVNLVLKGESLGFIIGRRGETLDALQYLTGLVINRMPGDYVRVTIDSGNFREKREKTLESLARRLARNAVKSGKSVTLEPMNPYERRIIHAAVSGIEGATSTSVGDEPNRRVVISSLNPKKREFKPRYNNNKGGRGYNNRPRDGRDNRGGGSPKRSDRRKPEFRPQEETHRPAAPSPSSEAAAVRNTPPMEAKDLPLFSKIELD